MSTPEQHAGGQEAAEDRLSLKTRKQAKQQPFVATQPKAVIKFKKYDACPDPAAQTKKAPSHYIQQLTKPDTHVDGWRPKPKVIELLNITEYSHHSACSVPLEEPIFQPFPPEVTFFGYEAFKEYEALLCLRNNDVVPRRVKIEAPNSQYFSIQRISGPGGQEGAKVASGMEVVYTVTFRPQSTEDYSCELVVVTEREKYLVPITALGTAPALDLPDQLDFGQVATKLSNTQVVLLRNVGNRQATFQLTPSQHFSVSPQEGSLEPGDMLQLRVTFTPPTAGQYTGEVELRYGGSNLTAYTKLKGTAADLDVGLSTHAVTLLPTYVTKMSQKTFKIVNNSREAISFQIKANSSAEADLSSTQKQLEQLDGSYGTGRQYTKGGSLYDEEIQIQNSDQSEDEDTILAVRPAAVTKSLKDQRRSLNLDQQLFGDKNFVCEPSVGQVMPGTEVEVVVHFTPDFAREYKVAAYVDVQGRAGRLPISFTAQGLGPAAVFSYDTLDVGDVYANTPFQYEVELQNRGKIDVQYTLLAPGTAFGSKFSFVPDSGHLAGGQIQVIKVKLLSDLLGPFDEVFRWAIKGSSTPLNIQFRGRVTGPSCEVDTQLLDFGIVSYGFRYAKEFVLTNTSEIPMKYSWRIPEDAAKPPEFQILPQKGSILPHGKQRIVVELVSSTVQRYTDHNLVLDIPDVLQGQLAIPVRAECAVPRISAEPNPLAFGECFVRYPYKQTLVLKNPSKLPAKFEVQPQSAASAGLAAFTAEPAAGVIPAMGEQHLDVSLCTKTLGRVQLPLAVLVPGSKGRPLEVTIDAKSMGPHLMFGPAGAPVEALASELGIGYGACAVLKEHVYQLQVHNPCLIPADCKLFIEASDSPFSITPSELHLEPGCSGTATVTVLMDDLREFKDVLHVLISEGDDICIPLTATGSGKTLVCEALAGPVLEFKHQFVGKPFEQQLVVQNMGRKQQDLSWVNLRFDQLRQQYSKAARAAGKKFSLDMVPAEEQPVFSITPEHAVLQPRECCTFTFAGLSLSTGDVNEQLVCTVPGTKTPITIFDVTAHALVGTPLLELSQRNMTFTHTYIKDVPITPITQSLTLRNVSKLPLNCELRTAPPFYLDNHALKLAQFECATINVTLDPAYRGDQQSGVIKQKLQITYPDNPQRDQVNLTGCLNFPNLTLDRTDLPFGSCLSDTTRRLPLTLHNPSTMDVVYTWAWDQESVKEDANSIASMSMKSARQPKPPAVQLFDILPIKGVLKAGESVTASASFFAYPGVKASVTAMCIVEGGPTYQVPMSGESNNIKFAIEPQFLDLGQQLFTKPVERELVISNQGKVPFDFNLSTRLLSRPSIVTPLPKSGEIGPGQKQTIKLRVLPGVPAKLEELLQLELAHFDPITIQLEVEGVYPAVLLNLPRLPDPVFGECLDEAMQVRAASMEAQHQLDVLAGTGVERGITGGGAITPTHPHHNNKEVTIAAGSGGGAGRGAGSPTLTDRSKNQHDNLDGAKSVTGMSVTAKSVGGVSAAAKSHAARSVAMTSKTGVGKKGAAQLELPAERLVELEAERLRLIKLISEAELEQVRAQEQALLAAELEQARLEQQLQAEEEEAAGGVQYDEHTGAEVTLAVGMGVGPGAAGSDAGASGLAATTTTLQQAAPASTRSAAVAATQPKQQQPQQSGGGDTGRRTARIQPPLPALYAAHYLVDFGCIIKGATKTRKFKLTNPSCQAVSFKWDKILLESWGIKAEPEAVSKLPGAPQPGSVEVAFSLATGKKTVPLGPLQLAMPLPIKGSPPVLLTLKADVQVPDLELSQEVLSFGKVQTGKCKVITVQLRNTKPIPCEWEVKKPVETTKAKDWGFFRCEPSSGVLEPGAAFNMRVLFTPVLHRDAPYQQTIPIKIASNPRGKELSCTAGGETPRVVFEPGQVKCGAILPARPGQAPNEARFKVINPCPFPVELVSLDFDTRYKSDEEVLRGLDPGSYAADDTMYLEPLEPGAALWPDIVAAHAQRQALLAAQAAAEAAAAEAAAAAAGEEGQAQQGGGVGELEQVGTLDAVAGSALDDLGQGLPAEHDRPKTIILMHGTSTAGVSTQAQLVGGRYGLPVFTLDDLLFEGADLEPPIGYVAPPKAEVPATPPPAATKGGKAAEPPPPVIPAFDPSAPPVWDDAIADALYSRVFIDPELESQPGFVPPHTKLSQPELHNLLLRGLRQAIAFGAPFERGFVLDRVMSRYCDEAIGMKLLLQAAGMSAVQPPEPEVDPKAKGAKPKGGKGAPVEEAAPVLPEAWQGPHNVFVVVLDASKEVVVQRLKERKEAAAAAAAAARAAEEEQAQLLAQQQEGSGDAVQQQLVEGEQEQQPAEELSPEQLAEQAAAQAAAEAAELDAQAQTLLDQAAAQKAALLGMAGVPAGSALPDGRVVEANQARVLAVPVGLTAAPEQTLLACCGITFKLGARNCILPELPQDANLIPEPYLMQVVHKPRDRPPRQPISKFKLYTVATAEAAPEDAPGAQDAPPKTPPKTPPGGGKPAAGAKGGAAGVKGGKGAAPEEPAVVLNPLYHPATRFTIPAQSSQEMVVLFQSEELGRFSDLLGFEVLGGDKLVSLPVSGVCDYPRVSSDYRNVFMKKVKARPATPSICRQYVISGNTFEFGPLLVGKDPDGYLAGRHPDNTAKLRITNNGMFPAHVELCMKSKVPAEDGKAGAKKPAAAAAGKAGDKGGGKQLLDDVFVLSHQTLDLAIDETQEVCLYAFPVQEGRVEDSLVIKITDNPDAIEFPICVLGAKPVANIRIDDGTPTPPADATPAPPPPEAAAKPKTPPKGGKAAQDAGPVNKLLTEGMVFERLLCGKRETQHILVHNPGVLPLQWRLTGLDTLPPELTITPTSGRLDARSETRIAVEFAALEKREVTAKLGFEVVDVAELLGMASAQQFGIKAEGYKMEVDVKFPQEGQACLDYGTVRVVDTKQLPLVLKNNGKYQVKFALTLKTAAARELFTLQPETGVVDPGKDVSVAVIFNAGAALKREVTLVNAPDIQLAIIEPLTANKAESLPVRVSLQAVFSRYTITPARGLIFGPLTYGNTSKPRTFDISNTGDFAFDFNIYDLANPPAAAGGGAAAAGKDKKAVAPPKGGKGGATAGLAVGQFTVEPATGTVQPGTKMEVAVVFKAEGAQVYRETLGIDIGERNVTDCPEGIPYELMAESCVPGIDTSSLEAIFEEHTISSSLDPAGTISYQLGLRERAFSFGPVIANLTAAAGAVAGGGGKGGEKGKGTAGDGGAAGGKEVEVVRGGVQAALKFTNPIKVPCTLNLSLKPKQPAVDPKAPGAGFPMQVVPSQLVIPPQESRYTTLWFEPTAISQYVATLEAVVEGGTDARTKSFSCEIRGQGTLPSMSMLEPKTTDAQGQPLIAFGRMLLGQTVSQTIHLKNNGQLRATSRLEAPPHTAFTVDGGPPGAFTLEPGRSVMYTVQFRPQQLGAHSHEVRLRVQNNPYEQYCIKVTGEGYQDDVTFDSLPGGALDTVKLQDAALGETRQAVFTLRNHTASKHFKFKWPATAVSLSLSPMTGYLLAGASKDVTLTFKSDAAVKLGPAALKLALSQISFPAASAGSTADGAAVQGEPIDWDDRCQVVEYSPEGEAQRKPESAPVVTDVPGTAKDLELKVFATADNARYTCGAPVEGIVFKPTMMFQTRTFTFPLNNTSTSQLNYRFNVLSADGSTLDVSRLYSITPEGGVIEPGCTTTVTVRFSPEEVVDCARTLVADIPGLDPALSPLAIRLDARVLRPWCHFELTDSDYIAAGRRDTGLPGPSGAIEPLDPATKVLEFESLGVKVRNTKRFLVLNPTGVGYEFCWEPQGPASSSPASPFRCVTRSGTIGPGRQFEMVFEYLPQQDEKTEAFWMFTIPSQSISLPFLLVGHVSEPRVSFDKPCLNFGQCLVGGARGHGSVTILNAEELPFSFQLDTSSYDASAQQVALLGRRPAVEFSPTSGVIPPKGSVTLQAVFSPTEERLYNYNLVCKVSNKPTRLSLNVKGEGYAIRQVLQLEEAEGQAVVMTPAAANHIDFGQVIVNERAVKAFSLINTGALAYDFLWNCGANPRVTARPESGTLGKGQRCVVELAYHPHGPDKLRDYKVSCQIVNGPTYALLLHGAGHKPRLDLSFLAHDFGTCGVWQPGMHTTSKVLRLTNNDTQPIAVDPQWSGPTSAPGDVDVWATDMQACVLQPGQSRDVAITFRPTQAKTYNDRLLLEVNGLFKVGVDVQGEGAPLSVGPATALQQVVNFGAVPCGQSCTRTCTITNKGRVATQVALSASAQELLTRLGIQLLPATPVMLRPRERVDYSFMYKPAARQRPWTEELQVELNGVATPLLTLKGSCSGTQLTLASDMLPFGPVAQGSSTSKRLALDNTGDTGTKFSWDVRALAPHFSITPVEGFLAPGQSARLEITFKPTGLSADIRAERVRCRVEGSADQFLTITGACIAASAQPDALNFNCAVRATATQSVTLSNPSSSLWQLRPTVSGDMFTGAELVDVPAGGKASYTVTYRPLSMTAAGQPHEGSLFFGVPDGSGLLYRLAGTATAPKAEGVVDRAITAKQPHVEMLSVANWLPRPQRFRVEVERKAGDVATLLEAPQYVDVPGHGRKDVKLSVYSYTPSVTQAVVTFRNEETQEFVYYELKFTAAAGGRQGQLVLECPVRVSTTSRVSIRNPLETPITLRGSASHKLLRVAPTTVIEPGATLQLPVSYRPLLVGSEEAVLKLESTELGVYEWGVKLVGLPTNPEKALAFNVPLGGRDTQTFKFTHWLEDKADYKVSFASGAKSMFEAQASLSVQPAPAGGNGIEAQIDLSFEPTSVSDVLRDTLVLSSPTGGEYHIPLLGCCVAPRPQGPVDCSKGSGSVAFKNIFQTDADFMYSVDNPAFTVKPSEKLSAKKPAAISVTYKPDPKVTPDPSRTGKLTVTCPSQTSVAWVFYLQA